MRLSRKSFQVLKGKLAGNQVSLVPVLMELLTSSITIVFFDM